MKFKDLIHLGKESIKNRKKSTRNTVCGLAFALTILIPMLFFTMSFSIDLTNTINNAENVYCFGVSVVNANDPLDGHVDSENSGYTPILGHTDKQTLYSLVGDTVDEILEFSYMDVNGKKFLDVGEKSYPYKYNAASSSPLTKMKISPYESSKFITDGVRSNLERQGKSFLSCGREFSENSKGEVLISEKFLADFFLTPNAVLNKKISLSATDEGYSMLVIDNDNDPNNEYEYQYTEDDISAKIFSDFTVVGVISNDYYALNDNLANDADIWVTGQSYYSDQDKTQPAYQPVLKLHQQEEWEILVATYTQGFDAMQQQALRDGKIFCAVPVVNFSSEYGVNTMSPLQLYNPTILFVQCKDFVSSLDVSEVISSCEKRLGVVRELYETLNPRACQLYNNFNTLYTTGQYVMLFLYFFGGSILLATLLNLFNSINYSVEIRRRYLGMMCAVGAKKSELPRMYLIEMLIIFARSLPWDVPLSAVLSYAIKFVVDRAFSRSVQIFSVAMNLNFWHYFTALAITVVALILIALIFSRIALYKTMKRSIPEMMSADT